nr:tyrosine-type recombinase/integrase [Streptomyces sp. SID8379]
MSPGSGPDPVEKNLTFRQWAEDWLTRRRAKETSVQRYESAVRLHLNPRWGSQRLRTIKKAQVESWVLEMEANEQLANSTGDGHWKVFKMIIKDAHLNGQIPSNPTYGVDGPYVGDTTFYVFSPDECWAIYDAFPALYRPLPMLGYSCGVRQAEAFAVCDDAIDSKKKLLTVHRQVLKIKELRYRPTIVDRLKTSPRLNTKTVPTPQHLLDALGEHAERFPLQPEPNVLWEHKKTIADCKRGLVLPHFRARRNNLICRHHFNESVWKPTLTKLGIKDENGDLPTFHDLRHTFISTCLQNGIPEHTVAAWVGDSVEELRRTYSHLLRDHADTHGATAAALTARPAAAPRAA